MMDSAESHQYQSPADDIFAKAVDITVIAKNARDQASYSKERVHHIEELARQAREESEKLHDVARALASTATSVAAVALQVCHFDSFQEAFLSRKEYSNNINLDSFLSIVEKKPHVSDTTNDPDTLYEEGAFGTAEHGGFRNYNSAKSRRRPPSDGSSSDTSQSSRVGLEAWDPQCLVGKPIRVQQVQQQESRPNYGDLTHISGKPITPFSLLTKQSPTGNTNSIPRNNSSASSSSSPASSAEKFVERFPRQVYPDEYKATAGVGSFHDSVTSMTPLWEDRYCHLAGEVSRQDSPHAVAVGKPETWNEKKSRKQFQMKLQHACSDASSSSMETCDDGSSTSVRSLSSSSSAQPQDSPLPRRLVPLDGVFRRRPKSRDGDTESHDTSAESDQSQERCSVPPLLMYGDDYEAEDEAMSSDNEVETFLKEQTRAGRLRVMEQTTSPGSRHLAVGTKDAPTARSVSPLLNEDEREHYGVSPRGTSPSKQSTEKHLFQLKKSPLNDE